MAERLIPHVDIITKAALLVASLPIIAGCSNSETPQVDRADASADEIASAAAIPDTELLATKVVPSPNGATLDLAFKYASKVDDVIAEPKTVQPARTAIYSITNPQIKNDALTYVNYNLASNAQYAEQNFYTYDDDSANLTNRAIDKAEAINDQIDNPEVKTLAETVLDSAEGLAVADATENGASKTAASLLANIENPEILAITQKATGGDKAAISELRSISDSAQLKIDNGSNDGFHSLYDGSNSQAQAINDDITRFVAARNK